MISIQKDFSLQALNTFGMNVKAAAYSAVSRKEQLPEMASLPEFQKGVFVLGGGSNLLLTRDIQEWAWHNQIKGIRCIKEDEDYVWLEAGAGETWHDFVLYAIGKGYGGIENLSLIPGNVGAAPVQNIGAYGVEVKEVITTVKAWHLQEQCDCSFSNEACRFGYRDSIFKNKLRNQVFITSIICKLRKSPVFNIGYGAIQRELAAMKITTLSVKAISEAVIRIRRSKLPDPAVVGNAGSFFKNPEVPVSHYETLRNQYSDIPGYPTPSGRIKVPAGWLIEQCGWKGYRQGDIGVHPRQALVLVNYGTASGKEVLSLSEEIITSVKQQFNITLEREVQVYV